MTAIVTDTFTEGSNANLSAHTPEVGGAWSYAMGTWTVVAATDIVQLSAGQEFAWNAAVPSGADYYAEVTGRTVATAGTDRFGVVVRGDGGGYAAAGTDCYYAYIRGDGVLSVLEQTNGVIAAPSGYSGDYTIPGFSASTDYTLRLQVSGSTITAYLDGVSRATASDSTISAAGRIGIYLRNSSAYITSINSDDGAAASLTLAVDKADIAITGQSIGFNLSMNVSPASLTIVGNDVSLTTTQPAQGGGGGKRKHKLPPTTKQILERMKQEEEIPFVPPPVEIPAPIPIAAEVREVKVEPYDDRPDRARLAAHLGLIAKKVIQRKRNESAARMLLGL